MSKNLVIIGASGSIGSAIVKKLSELYPNTNIYAFSRISKIKYCIKNVIYKQIDYVNEVSIKEASEFVYNRSGAINLVFVAIGILHKNGIKPEKSLKELSENKFMEIFRINTILPALIAKYFIPKLDKNSKSIFAVISARIGSISDNKLGGWYSYRISKAALNMLIKTASIEIKRSNPGAIIVGLHPGTVDSILSKPFQTRVPKGKLFTPEYSAKKLINVLNNLNINDSGKLFSWNSKEINP